MTQESPASILVIGGSGFLSGAIVRAALAGGNRVWTLTRGKRPIPAGAIPLYADRKDPDAFVRAVTNAQTRWDLVVDSIAYSPTDGPQDVAVFSPLARQLVLVSTDFVYDPAHRRFPQAEETAHYLQDGYGNNKRRCELAFIQGNTGDMQWSIVRPCHIYGPGSLLGCLPLHRRDPQLIDRLRAGAPLRLAGGGHFLQQPVFVDDLAQTILSLRGDEAVDKQIFNVAGPDIVESREYYRIVAGILGVGLQIVDVPVDAHLREHPESASYLCHRIYDPSKLRAAGLALPSTHLEEGLRTHVTSLLEA